MQLDNHIHLDKGSRRKLADKLAKETVRNKDIVFIRIPESEIAQQARDQSIAK